MAKVAARVKRASVAVLSRTYVRQGIVPIAARLLVRESIRDRFEKAGSAPAPDEPGLSRRQFYELHPLNPPRRWLSNRVIARRVVPGLADLMEAAHCVVSRAAERADGVSVVPLESFPAGVTADIDGLVDLIRRRGVVRVLPLRWDRGAGFALSAIDDGFLLDGRPVSLDELREALVEVTSRIRCIVLDETERLEVLPGVDAGSTLVRLYVAQRDDQARVLDAEVLGGDVLRETGERDDDRLIRPRAWLSRSPFYSLDLVRGRFASRRGVDETTGALIGADPPRSLPGYVEMVDDIEAVLSHRRSRFAFISVDVVLAASGGYRLVDIASRPVRPHGRDFSPAAVAHLQEMRRDGDRRRAQRARAASARHRVRRGLVRARSRVAAFSLRSAGFIGPSAKEWNRLRLRDRRSGRHSAGAVRRAHALGFRPGTMERFAIGADGARSFLSERDYLYAQPLNGKYAKWIRDRVSVLMVFRPFDRLFAPTHFQVYRRDRGLHLVPLSEEATALGADLDALAQLLQSRGELVLTPTRWRERVIARVSHDGRRFRVNGMACTPGELFELLASYARRASLLFVERRGDGTVAPTEPGEDRRIVRVTMMNATGDDPRAAEVLLRIPATLPAPGAGGGEEPRDTTPDPDEAPATGEAVESGSAAAAADAEAEDAAERRAALWALADPETGDYRDARRAIDGELRTFERHPNTGERIAGRIEGWPDALRTLQEMCRFAPQLRFLQFTLELSDGSVLIRRIAEKPLLSAEFPASPEMVAFIQEQVDEKRRRAARPRARIARGLHNAKLKLRREFAKALYPQGLLPYQSVRWLGDIRRDLLQRNGVPIRTKLWAYRNGFLSYRVPQYEITPANRTQFISDFEYRWLRHINTRYKYWLEDKISIKYVAAEYNEFLPGYYYMTSTNGGRNHLIPMMDCPPGYEARFDEVLRLAREKGILALKPDEGSHGDGFYRLAHEDGGFTLNGVPATEDEVLAILRDPENRYLVTEFIRMHPRLAEIYPTSVNTIRMIVFKRDAATPELGTCYLRIGSEASGYVDNTAAGGLLARIDVASGRFGDAKVLENGRVVDSPCHPDTGVLIEGVIPNWELVKAQVLEMAASFSQLEYLGFDVAITEDGFKIPEINRFPDFPRIERLTPATIDYLLMKLGEKKRQYGYHRRRPRRLISLPRRDGS
ncbi:MAG: sugar-transfer associated ATP-grasp domain-containing protein [Microbacterium sp.]